MYGEKRIYEVKELREAGELLVDGRSVVRTEQLMLASLHKHLLETGEGHLRMVSVQELERRCNGIEAPHRSEERRGSIRGTRRGGATGGGR